MHAASIVRSCAHACLQCSSLHGHVPRHHASEHASVYVHTEYTVVYEIRAPCRRAPRCKGRRAVRASVRFASADNWLISCVRPLWPEEVDVARGHLWPARSASRHRPRSALPAGERGRGHIGSTKLRNPGDMCILELLRRWARCMCCAMCILLQIK
jgi:hypothetical protein